MGTKTFSYNDGSWQKFTVPNGVKVINVEVYGAGSGTAQGGRVFGKLSVSGGEVYYIKCGGNGDAPDGAKGGLANPGGGGVGGDGTTGRSGGRSGGGGTWIRKNRTDGRIIAVAGGAGGRSGDGGNGGNGGGNIGAPGQPGTEGTGPTWNSTGGTQNQGGKGGTSNAGTAFWGKDGNDIKLGRAGRGGSVVGAGTGSKSDGGGGGGGGYYPGAGGQASAVGKYPGGGGSGGSNFTGGLYSVSNYQGGYNGNGQVVFMWEDPGGNTPPTVASDVKIAGKAEADGLATKATNSVTITASINDADKDRVRMLVHLSTSPTMTNHSKWLGTFDAPTQRDKVTITGLSQDTRYYVRIYTQDHHGKRSQNYNSTNFWTNRRPDPPTIVSPDENVQFPSTLNMTFDWTHNDPDPNDGQKAFNLRYRRAGTPVIPVGEWIATGKTNSSQSSWVIDANTFKGNTFYEWQVRTWDQQDRRGEWSDLTSFYVTAEATPPILIHPTRDEAIVAAEEENFQWKFLTPHQEVTQERADIRHRAVGTDTWNYLYGNELDPGASPFMLVPGLTFEPGYRYEWQARTHTSAAVVSDWSDSAYFWATAAPGSGAGISLIDSGRPQDPLGVGENRAFVYNRGGKVLIGEIAPLVDITWHRRRDDISSATLHLNEWDEAGRKFLGSLRCWMHELVVFRDGVRVWEGPITRISGDDKNLEIEAKDVMGYVYRRVMRQGYNDAYRLVNATRMPDGSLVGGTQIGQRTVVERSSQIIMNALAYDDPNVLAYLTPMNMPGDARTSRVVKDFTRTAWEEVDDLAATAGLDYTVSGRRIILWDTHQPIGRLPEMRDGDFSASPIVSEYGMSAANFFAVTNNNGVYGVASTVEGTDPGPTGWLEQLASAYGESEGAGTEQTLTRESLKRLQQTLATQAQRNINGRDPAPLVVRVPDNSALSPELNIGINQLIPGVWIPLRATNTIREVAQWQKLDSMTVTQDQSGEKITVVMSPAPNGGEDPDADLAAIEEG